MIKHALTPLLSSALLATVVFATAVRADDDDCRPPPTFEPFCSTGARTGALVQVVVTDGSPAITVGTVVGEPIVATGDVLQLDCATPQDPTCGLPEQAAVLLTSPTTLAHAERLIEGFQLAFANADNRVTAQEALQAATDAGNQTFGDPGLCIEALYVLTGTARDQGLDENACDDGIFCGAGNGVDVSLLAIFAVTWRRRRRADRS